MYYGPWKFLGIWFSIKLDHTPIQHFFIAILMSILHWLIAPVFYLSKEYREGTGPEQYIGKGKCLQGFGILDFIAAIAGTIVYVQLIRPIFEPKLVELYFRLFMFIFK